MKERIHRTFAEADQQAHQKVVDTAQLAWALLKVAVLGGYLGVWACGRTGDMATLAVNWDVQCVRCPDGRDVYTCEPTSTKTK